MTLRPPAYKAAPPASVAAVPFEMLLRIPFLARGLLKKAFVPSPTIEASLLAVFLSPPLAVACGKTALAL